MKTEYKYIRFEQSGVGSGVGDKLTTRWICLNKKHGDRLGMVCWYQAWKQFVFQPDNADFSASCLVDIIDFMKQLED